MHCFEHSLSKKRDSGFFTCGQLCQFVRTLACRCYLSTNVPDSGDWLSLLEFKPSSIKPLSSRPFLKRIQLENKVAAADKVKAEQEISERSGSRDGLEKATDKIIDLFLLDCSQLCHFPNRVNFGAHSTYNRHRPWIG